MPVLLTLSLLGAGVILFGVSVWLLEWRLTIDWPFFWRKWSSWLAAVNAAAWAYVTTHTGLLLGFIPFLSRSYQGFAAGAVFVAAVVIPILAVHIRQPAVREAATERAVNKALDSVSRP